jgi:hypothetical protein
MYSLKLTLIKVIKYALLVGIPFLTAQYPDITNLTIGAALVMIYDFCKHKLEIRLP